ncbi:hypothetical protein AMK68_05000 [candidate division KD3-62 bacterium DG_56]|uniref:endo-1,4-beta-xylanase n=1 Tax=candidate division KD3-62 bacterium DG_56 TaxID=1704032 RepID=A0A0S7XJD9_9BACT|nr:MAG: hypothetical protein AMK68_05000 [candidate division KD3-62 bacterium DG_56]
MRHLARLVLIAAAFIAIAAGAFAAPQEEATQVIIIHDAQGQPLPKARLGSLYLSDVLLNPFACQIDTEDGRAICRKIAQEPFAISLRYEVTGFGDVYFVADNLGRGYRAGEPINLVYEFARSRMGHARKIQKAAREAGCDLKPTTRGRINKAQALLNRAHRTPDTEERSRLGYQSLQESAWAGEMALLDKARFDVGKRGWRPGFRFGANAFRYGADPKYEQRFEELLNFGTTPFYTKAFEPKEGEYKWDRPEDIAAWLNGAGLTAKGHPVLWFYPGTTPDYLKQKSFEEIRQWVHDRTPTIIEHYAGSIDIWDIINEPHVQNVLNFTLDQMVDITRVVSEQTREANPNAVRIVNSCCLWAEYMKGQFGPDVRVCSPLEFLERLRAAKVDYDIVGLQLYYPGRDLLEISRMIDRFERFGKPVHITELAVPSSAEGDPHSHWKGPDAVRAMGCWHRPWDQDLQAEWVEQFYTICYSKPFVEAVTWWDFADYRPGHFFPHGGFLDHEYTPKGSFFRLQQLISRWREMGER